jgi:superoxide dismutase, Fe-Mn family
MAYSVPDLPYAYDALEPHIDEATMRVHHDKHHQAYVDKANAALEGTALEGKDIEDILKDLDQLPADKRGPVRNNGGGHHNHSLFWEILNPAGKQGSQPVGKLAEAINKTFGGFDKFKEQFTTAATTRFGSGWAWLVKRGQNLEVISTANQDSPIMEGAFPVIGLDVWEHAYYLKYQNRRPDYITAWWSVVNWQVAEERYNRAQ